MSGSPLPPSTGAPAGARRWASILLWACTLALLPVGGPVRAAADIAERVVAVGDFQALREALVDSIEEEGLVVSAIIPFNDMLQRTALAAGPAAVSPFLRAEIVQFCSSRIAWQLLAEDPAQIALCPLSITIQQTREAPGQLRLAWRPTAGSTAGRRAADALLERLVGRAAGLVR